MSMTDLKKLLLFSQIICDIEPKEIIKSIANICHISERTAYRYINEYEIRSIPKFNRELIIEFFKGLVKNYKIIDVTKIDTDIEEHISILSISKIEVLANEKY
jgi:hypothetical protein